MEKRYGSFRTGFLKFLHMVKTEYTEGEKLPSADAVCKRLKISRNTYSKILKEAHGHAHIIREPGRAVFVRTPSLKVGLYLGRGEYSPMIKQPFLLSRIITMLDEMKIPVHLITQPDPEKLPEELLVKNVSLLLAFDWDSHDKPGVEIVFRNTFQESGVPILILEQFPSENPGLPGVSIIRNNKEFAAREIAQLMRTRGLRKILTTHPFFSWPRNFPEQKEYEISILPQNRKLMEKPDSFLSFLRRKKPDLLLVGGGVQTYLSAFTAVRKLSVKNRPAILCAKNCDTTSAFFERETKGVNLLGTFCFDTEIYAETVVDMIVSHLQKKRSLQDFNVNNFQIDLMCPPSSK